MCHREQRGFGVGESVGSRVRDELLVGGGVSCGVSVELRGSEVLVVVGWSVRLLLRWVDEGPDLCAYAQDVEACEAVESVFLHDWCCVCSWWFVCYESDDLLLCSDEWLEVGALGVGGAPDECKGHFFL